MHCKMLHKMLRKMHCKMLHKMLRKMLRKMHCKMLHKMLRKMHCKMLHKMLRKMLRKEPSARGYTNEVSFIRILRSNLQSTFHQNLVQHLTKYLS